MARWKRRLASGLGDAAWAARRLWAGLHETPDPHPRIAIGAIVRDEGPYLLEWVAWHRCLGITAFFIADNNSTDGTTALLRAMDGAGLVTHLPFPGEPGIPPQLPAYRMIAERHLSDTDWIAFIDADEFIRPAARCPDPATALPIWLGRLPALVGAVGLHWALFGSSDRTEPGSGLVVERFPHRAPQDFEKNNHIKSIIRCRNWNGLLGTPHGEPAGGL